MDIVTAENTLQVAVILSRSATVKNEEEDVDGSAKQSFGTMRYFSIPFFLIY
jgi:hypothetical protein